MDLKSLAERLDQMPIEPYFSSGHIVFCALYIRSDLGTNSLYFSRKHPLACWISTLLCIFSGTILSNFLLNEPVISVLGNTQQVLRATLAWYLIFYSPFDIVFRLCNFMPIKVVLNCMEEVYNCKSIYQGILHTAKIFPDSYVVMAAIGIVRGNGPGFIRLIERLVRGVWSMNVLEFMNPSFDTKISSIASVVFIANRYCDWLMISQPFIFFCVVSANIYLRLSALLLDLSDPFSPFENLICLLVFGGIWDALARVMSLSNTTGRAGYPQSSIQRARALRAEVLISNPIGRKLSTATTLASVTQKVSWKDTKCSPRGEPTVNLVPMDHL